MELKIDFFKFNKFLGTRFKESSMIVKKAAKIFVITHNDIDGIASSEILLQLMIKLKKEFKILKVSHITEKLLTKINNYNPNLVIFSDIGSFDKKIINFYLKTNIGSIILDHHKFDKDIKDTPNQISINPILWGGDGSKDACGASLSFGLFVSLISTQKYISNLLPSLFVGICSDKQNKPFSDYNLFILKFFIEKNLVGSMPENIYSSFLKSKECLAYNLYPFVKNFSGSISNSEKFLKDLNIDSNTYYSKLTELERKKIENKIQELLIRQTNNSEILNFEYRKRYYIKNLHLTFEDIEILYRFNQYFIPSFRINFLNKAQLRDIYQFLKRNFFNLIFKEINNSIIEETSNFYYFINKKNIFSSIICEILYFYFTNMKKPFFLFRGIDTGILKISSRGTKELIKNENLDLSQILSKFCKKYGGQGGGHPIASGGLIPLKKINFEKILNELNKFMNKNDK